MDPCQCKTMSTPSPVFWTWLPTSIKLSNIRVGKYQKWFLSIDSRGLKIQGGWDVFQKLLVGIPWCCKLCLGGFSFFAFFEEKIHEWGSSPYPNLAPPPPHYVRYVIYEWPLSLFYPIFSKQKETFVGNCFILEYIHSILTLGCFLAICLFKM